MRQIALTKSKWDELEAEYMKYSIKQSLTEYVQKEIQHHLDTSGEGITAFCHRIGMQSQRVKGFLAGVTSLQLNTADRILKAIDEWEEYK